MTLRNGLKTQNGRNAPSSLLPPYDTQGHKDQFCQQIFLLYKEEWHKLHQGTVVRAEWGKDSPGQGAATLVMRLPT